LNAAPRPRAPHGIALGLFVLVWFSCAWFGSDEFNPNTSTRLFAAIGLAERHDPAIDRYAALTIDKARFGDHLYLDKAPGMTLIATPLVWATDAATGDRADAHPADLYDPGLTHYMALRLRVVTSLFVAPLTAFAAVLLLDLAIGITGSVAAGLAAALGYALGTPVWGWSTTMLEHAPVSALLLIAFWAIWRGTADARDLARARYPLIAGGALGLAGLIELQAALPAALLLLWMLWRTRDLSGPRRLRLFALGAAAALIALLPMALYDRAAFGTPFHIGYQGVVGFSGMSQGFFGLGVPRFDVAIALLAGLRRGLIWVAPVLLLAPFGIARLIAARETRDLGWLAAALALVMLLYNAAYVYWDGGDSTGPRHLVPAFGFLALGLAPLWRGRWRRPLVVLLGLSLAINGAVAATTITARDVYAFPLTDQVIPALLAGKVRTIANQFWGWPGWAGMMLYLVVALPLLGWLVRRTRETADA